MIDLPCLEEFLLSLENNNYSAATVKNYRRDLDIFAAFLEAKKLEFQTIEKLTISTYKGFLRNQNYRPLLRAYKQGKELPSVEEQVKTGSARMQKHPGPGRPVTGFTVKDAIYKGQLSAMSINRMLSSLRSYMNFLVDNDKAVPIPPSSIKMIKTERKQSQVADLNDLIKLIESPTEIESREVVGKRNRAVLELIFSTGMRISEVVNLNKDQLRTDANGKIIDDRVYIQGKGKKQRFVYLTPRGREFLEEYLSTRHDNYPAVFIPTKGTRAATENPYIVRISQNYIQMKIAEYRRRIGLNLPTSAHSLRHGFATYLAEEGASPAAIQHLLGHESLNTTTRYVHASDRFAEKEHRKFHPLQDEDTQPTESPNSSD